MTEENEIEETEIEEIETEETESNDSVSSNNKREAFLKLAPSRMTKAIKSIQLLGNLANRNSYDYEDKHIEKMMATLIKEVETLQEKFKKVSGKAEKEFSFED